MKKLGWATIIGSVILCVLVYIFCCSVQEGPPYNYSRKIDSLNNNAINNMRIADREAEIRKQKKYKQKIDSVTKEIKELKSRISEQNKELEKVHDLDVSNYDRLIKIIVPDSTTTREQAKRRLSYVYDSLVTIRDSTTRQNN